MTVRVPVWISILVVAIFLVGRPALGGELSKNDARWLKKSLTAMDLGRWKTAGTYARRVKEPLARKYLAWKTLSEPNAIATFELLDLFLRASPDWPYQRRMRKRAEELLDAKMPPEEIIAWFGDREPVGAVGWGRLAGALLKTGERDKAVEIIRRIWVEGNFPKRDEKAFYRRYRKHLTAEDHRRRLDRLLWDGKYWPVRRMMWKVSKDWRALAEARISLRRRTGNVDRLITLVPQELKDHPGLVYERLRWRRRKGKDSAYELLMPAPEDLVRPDLWWQERAVLARRAIAKGHVTGAYRIVSDHRVKEGPALADAEWMSGWIALRFLKDHGRALAHFEKMYASVKYPISRARGAYWAGRAVEAAGDETAAAEWYGRAIAHPTTYYGQLALAKVRPGDGLELSPDTMGAPPQTPEFKDHELAKLAYLLGKAGEEDRLRPIIRRIYNLSEEPAWRLQTAHLARVNGRFDLSISVSKYASRDGFEMIAAGYPTLEPPMVHRRAQGRKPEKPFVLAVIRQESAFRVNARSSARALGLMQLLPRTARRVAKGLRMRYSRAKLTRDPNYNMTLGQAYLGGLLEDFGNSYVLALGAYNAGPARVKRWIKKFGDPRDPEVDAIDWVEQIPFDETRNYVQRVLENLQVYRTLLADTEIALGLEDDLHQ